MDWPQIQTSLVGALVGVVVWALKRWLGVKDTQETRAAVTWAFEQGVALAAEKWKDASRAGQVKKETAIKVAESLAPKATAKLTDEQKSVLVDATYAKMKASLPHASTYSFTPEEPDRPS